MRFIKTRQVLEMLGVSRTTLWRMVQDGSFPYPVQIKGRNAHYVLQAVEAWMRARVQRGPREAKAAPAQPARVAQGRQPKPTMARQLGGPA
jgi:prophage regulatory protein